MAVDRYDELTLAEYEERPVVDRQDERQDYTEEYAASFVMPPVQAMLRWLRDKPQDEVVGAPADYADCPIRNFLKSLGVPIASVGIFDLEFSDGSQYHFTDEKWSDMQSEWIEHCRTREGLMWFNDMRLMGCTIMAREAYVLVM